MDLKSRQPGPAQPMRQHIAAIIAKSIAIAAVLVFVASYGTRIVLAVMSP